MRWPRERLFALAIDGTLLMNARALDDVSLAELAGRLDVFVGVPLGPAELARVRDQLINASSEAAALIAGGRTKRSRRRGHRPRRQRV
jgi:hypothetical protein